MKSSKFYSNRITSILSAFALAVTVAAANADDAIHSEQGAQVLQAAQVSSNDSEETAETVAAGGGRTSESAADKLTLEQLRSAMQAADQRRLEALRPDPGAANDVLVKQWGVEILGISRTAGGYMLDFRFRVLDAEKALPLFDHRSKPYVKPEKSSVKLPVPVGAKVGALRPTNRGKNIKPDKIYYMVFSNPDSYVKEGDKVSVIIGDFKAENLTVN